ncbi:hypothetical protein COW36_14400 [bacterium (Candidatus Blackallbacteria) CG17_big_fil_post_rev_8_21_14_2_50_48_46]|uniref:HTH tetR-type domain-containing protein n=1 Tax=bacterium (Candidatus Blackallbacteria) CG17_big_fil_post_rev_8_21_14_2_50_48_46 TaxID=2014261 RepID=A0A2M7G322_9BACT|nr:MAG: hypothetical protein COW64_08925 [bacterium (Candidatus Blackallbacteria) CG18_big_fil_WC_8_21_14_2_50_49_26]PIW16151.1 MAG: hypothetical protein COW36_14400 [bacterium (Candidatus Blackallbacteria) CG17_big_fil_post_rev_8_21_14_2_50_48_46]PIW44238.1 MAG: hypothetical protein COW20_24730 [bacterium (Candidatus Blackallbacteria) CG13_big_fil_rev_8_21_14_2_50_49_14]
MKTKAKILAQTLVLFNAEGHEKVTTRQIALALGISQGHLCYHFPHKQDLVMALYQQLVVEFDQTLRALQVREFSFLDAFQKTYRMLEIQYRYQFLMHDFVSIMRTYPEIKAHFRALQEVRQAELRQIFKLLNARGWALLPLDSPAFSRLVEHYFIVGNAWMSEATILRDDAEPQRLLHYTELLLGLLYPWLTAEGREAFELGQAQFMARLALEKS